MGTRMMLYEIDQEKWWDFADEVLKFYLEDSYIASMARYMVQNKKFDKFFEYIRYPDNHVEIQVFEYEDKYLFRVLEAGYYFMNNQPEKFTYLIPHFYDDHGDMDEQMDLEEHWVDWVDELIHNHHYWVFPIIDENSFSMSDLMNNGSEYSQEGK